MKKILSSFLAGIMSISLLAGCGGNNQAENSKDSVSPTTQAVATETPPQKPKEAKVVWYWNNGGMQLPDDSYVSKKVKEDLNITYIHVKPASTNYEETLNLMLAAGDQLDVITCDGVLKQRLIREGVLQPIDQYLNEQYIKNLMYISNNWKKAMEVIKYSDGKSYTVPVTNNMSLAGDYYIRMDWLKNLGLQVPTTMEELKDVLVKFTKDDPDKNNTNDTWGTAISEIWGAYAYAPNMGAAYNKYYKTDDGNVTYYMFHPRVKEWIKYIKELVDSKAVNPEIMTLKYDQVIDMIKAGKVGFYNGFNPALDKDLEEIRKVHPAAEFEPIPALKGIYDEGYYQASGIIREEYGIASKAKDVEAIFRLMNYFADDKSTADKFDFTGTYFTSRYGEKGVNWDVKDGLLDTATFAERNKVDVWPGGSGRFRSQYDMSWTRAKSARELANFEKTKGYKNVLAIPVDHPAAPLSAEGIVLTDKSSAFQDDFSAKFEIYFAKAIYGKVGIDAGFDEFMTEADKAGYKDYVADVTKVMKDTGRIK